jgi:tRNA A37 threonylcarbamoyladenosine dehydratase
MSPTIEQRFRGIARVYGHRAYSHITGMHVCVIGLGGVGSWAAESLARSGVGQMTLIDYDEIAETNINRQLHAMDSTIGRKKIHVMRNRLIDINPKAEISLIDDYINQHNYAEYLANGYDYVVDAIDSIKHKATIIYYCRRNRISVITTGGAGGLTDPTMVKIRDLSKTYNDPLAAKVRAKLRDDFGYTRNPKRYFGVECVFSSQQPIYPGPDGTVSHHKPGVHGVHLDCEFGYGASSCVTAVFGFTAAGRVIHKHLAKHAEKD